METLKLVSCNLERTMRRDLSATGVLTCSKMYKLEDFKEI